MHKKEQEEAVCCLSSYLQSLSFDYVLFFVAVIATVAICTFFVAARGRLTTFFYSLTDLKTEHL